MADENQTKGANSSFPVFSAGDSAAKVLSASYQNKITGDLERLSQNTFGPGADALVTGPMIFRKAARKPADGVVLRHAVVTRICNQECAVYEIEFVDRSFSEDCGGTQTGSGT